MSPTFEREPRFNADYSRLTAEQRKRLLIALHRFVDDLKSGRELRPGLCVKAVRGEEGVFEMTFSPDGRATFEFGEEVIDGQPHVVWRRVGTHEVLDQA